MNCDQANLINIVDFLAKLGFYPESNPRPDEYWYLSPLPYRDERTPSFFVDTSTNTWRDWGNGEGFTLVDLCMKMFGFTQVKQVLEKLSASTFATPLIKITHREAKPKEPKIKILGVCSLTSPALLYYLRERCIPLEIASVYLQEISYELNGRTFYSLGFKNNSGGYELRNKFSKRGSVPKDITLLKGDPNRLAVFEGFFRLPFFCGP